LGKEEIIENKIRNNQIITTFYLKNGATQDIAWLCLRGHIYITNNHYIKQHHDECAFDLIQKGIIQKGISNNVLGCKFFISQLRRDEKYDLCYMAFYQVPPKSDIYKYIPLKYLTITLTCKTIVNTIEHKCDIDSRYNFGYTDIIEIEAKDLPVYTGPCSMNTIQGFCGAPVVAYTAKGLSLIGIHSIGAKNRDCYSGCTALTQDIINRTIYDLINIQVESNSPNFKNPYVEIYDLQSKSPFRYIEEGHCNVFGSLPKQGKNRPSKVCNTLMHDIAVDKGFKDIGAAPCMSSWEPWNIALEQMTKTNMNIDPVILNKCIQSYYNSIISKVPLEAIKKMMHPYDWYSVINGCPGITYVDGIKRSSSMGFPWCKSKRFFLKEDVRENYPDGVNFSDDILNRAHLIEKYYEKLITYSPVFQGNLKDEVVTKAKAEAKKTRVFFGGPTDWILVQRKYCLGFLRLIKNYKFEFGCAIGINAQSKEWNTIIDILKEKSPGLHHLFAGDYSKYDKTMAAILILGAFQIPIMLSRIAGWTEDQINIWRCMAEDIAYSFANFNGTLVQFFGTEPSGHAMTVEINSIVGDLLLRYAYYLTNPKHECESFDSNISRIIYGDDNLVSVGYKARNFYNHQTVSKALSSIGIIYTMADKESKSVPFLSIKDVTFLKRNFTFSKELNSYVGQLDENSLHKTMTKWVPSGTITKEEQALSVMSSVCREYFFYGEEIFEFKKKILISIVRSLQLDHMVEDYMFPTYSELKLQFEEYQIVDCVL
jgi:hypothetical protein